MTFLDWVRVKGFASRGRLRNVSGSNKGVVRVFSDHIKQRGTAGFSLRRMLIDQGRVESDVVLKMDEQKASRLTL